MCLYGHEIDDTTTVWEASLGWICKLDKGDFLGRDALGSRKNKAASSASWSASRCRTAYRARRLPGFAIGGSEVGRVTSGAPAPF